MGDYLYFASLTFASSQVYRMHIPRKSTNSTPVPHGVRTKCHGTKRDRQKQPRTKCHSRNERPDKMPLANRLVIMIYCWCW